MEISREFLASFEAFDKRKQKTNFQKGTKSLLHHKHHVPGLVFVFNFGNEHHSAAHGSDDAWCLFDAHLLQNFLDCFLFEIVGGTGGFHRFANQDMIVLRRWRFWVDFLGHFSSVLDSIQTEKNSMVLVIKWTWIFLL